MNSDVPVLASYFGPGLYGNRTACGQTLTTSLLGVAHRTLSCGTRVRVCYDGRCVATVVVDHGPWVYGRTLDLTSAVSSQLCHCTGWGVRTVRWSYGSS